jgi:hypothetical protein
MVGLTTIYSIFRISRNCQGAATLFPVADGSASSAGTFFLTNVGCELNSVPTMVGVWALAPPIGESYRTGFLFWNVYSLDFF